MQDLELERTRATEQAGQVAEAHAARGPQSYAGKFADLRDVIDHLPRVADLPGNTCTGKHPVYPYLS